MVNHLRDDPGSPVRTLLFCKRLSLCVAAYGHVHRHSDVRAKTDFEASMRWAGCNCKCASPANLLFTTSLVCQTLMHKSVHKQLRIQFNYITISCSSKAAGTSHASSRDVASLQRSRKSHQEHQGMFGWPNNAQSRECQSANRRNHPIPSGD
jgi:hypothetical protein